MDVVAEALDPVRKLDGVRLRHAARVPVAGFGDALLDDEHSVPGRSQSRRHEVVGLVAERLVVVVAAKACTKAPGV